MTTTTNDLIFPQISREYTYWACDASHGALVRFWQSRFLLQLSAWTRSWQWVYLLRCLEAEMAGRYRCAVLGLTSPIPDSPTVGKEAS